MLNRVMGWLRTIGPARGAVLMMATGLVGLGADVAVSHFAGREMKSALQLIPVIAAPLAFVALIYAGMRWADERKFRTRVRAVGSVLAAVGAVGTLLHFAAFVRLLDGAPLTMHNIEFALGVAPPIGAPSAFVAVGALLWLVVSPKLSLVILPDSAGALPARA
jgi:hypothetical protein